MADNGDVSGDVSGIKFDASRAKQTYKGNSVVNRP